MRKTIGFKPWNVDALLDIENESGKKINTILQLRLHPSIIALKNKVNSDIPNTKFDIGLTYITS